MRVAGPDWRSRVCALPGGRLLRPVCPHWTVERPVETDPALFEIRGVEECRICGLRRVRVRLPPAPDGRERDPTGGPGVDYVEVAERSPEAADVDLDPDPDVDAEG